MLLWSGWGIVAAIIPIGAYLLLTYGLKTLMGSLFLEANPWVVSAGVLVLSLTLWPIGVRLNSGEKTLIDPDTGGEVVLKPNHTLFFIQVQYWAFIVAAIMFIKLIKAVLMAAQ